MSLLSRLPAFWGRRLLAGTTALNRFYRTTKGLKMTCFRQIRAWRILYQDGTKEMTFKEPKGKEIAEELKLPCGKCLGCKLDKANDISTRCWCEATQWRNCCFITLTYDDKHLPKGGYLKKKHLQDFMKRFRYFEKGDDNWINPQTGKNENPIRYWCAGEYGPNGTRRPHYHILIFNWKPKDLKFYKSNKDGDSIWLSQTIKKIWGKGFITVEDLNYRTSCYVARYTTKKMFNDIKVKDLEKAKIQPEFTLCSKMPGIGLEYWKNNKNKILENNGIFIKIKDKVKLKRIPSYFERKYEEEEPKKYKLYKKDKLKNAIEKWNEILSKTSMTESEYLRTLENNLLEKAKVLRRDNFI